MDRDRSRLSVEALVGKRLTEEGDVEPLEPSQWVDQLARADFAPRPSDGKQGSPSTVDWSRPFLSTGSAPTGETGEDPLAALNAQIDQQPNLWTARLERADLHLAESRFDEAAADLEAAVAEGDRGWIIAWLKKGAVLSLSIRRAPSLADEEQAEPVQTKLLWCCERLLAIEPAEPTARLVYMVALLRADRFDEAKAVFDALVEAGPQELMLENLRFLMRVRTSASCRPWLIDRLVEAEPNDWQLLIDRANLAVLQDRWEDAAADIDRALELGPSAEIVDRLLQLAERVGPRTRGRGGFSTRSNQFPGRPANDTSTAPLLRAIPVLEKLLDIAPDQTEALRSLANFHARAAHWERAAELLAPLVEAPPGDYGSQSRLAPVLLKLGQADRYRELCRGMLEQFDESTNVQSKYVAIRTCLWQPGAVDDYQPLTVELRAILESRIRESEDAPAVTFAWYQATLGIAHFRAGEHPQAIEWLEKALESEPSRLIEVHSLAVLAMAYHQSGDEDKARELLDLATQRYGEEAPRPAEDDLGSTWPAWLTCELLLTEAKAQIAAEEK